MAKFFTNIFSTANKFNVFNINATAIGLQKEVLWPLCMSVRWKSKDVCKPKPGQGKAYRRIVHFPKEYTIEPLRITNLGGRDPISGRKVCGKIGGGIKHKYLWIDWCRVGPKEGPPLVEKVIKILHDRSRTGRVALIGHSDKLRYIIATENMKAGDLIKTSSQIPRIPVRANEGDAHPVAAYPLGTRICSVEKFPGGGSFYANSAGTFCNILRHVGDRVIVQLPSKHEVAVSRECMATMGRISNVVHNKTPIGSAQANRLLGNRPCSGLWHRKDGRHGRKIRPLPPVKIIAPQKPKPKVLSLTMTEYA